MRRTSISRLVLINTFREVSLPDIQNNMPGCLGTGTSFCIPVRSGSWKP